MSGIYLKALNTSPVQAVVLYALLFIAAFGTGMGSPTPAGAAETAHFSVLDHVVQPRPDPFTATIDGIGNGIRLSGNGTGFEPLIFRNRLQVTRGGKNTIFTDPKLLSYWDSWRTGAFDGADVGIYRIVDGAFQLVREDKIAKGGFQTNAWWRMHNGKVVAPDTPGYTFKWAKYNRRNAPYYFTVRAVDRAGNMSEPADYVTVVNPGPQKGSKPANRLIKHKTTGTASPSLVKPTGLTAQLNGAGAAVLSWNRVPGADGYAIFRSDAPPEQHKGSFIQLVGDGPDIRADDLVFLRHKFYRADRRQLLTNRLWDEGRIKKTLGLQMLSKFSDLPNGGDWSFVPHDANTPVEEPGETHLRVALAQGQKFDLGRYNYGGIAQDWYEILRPNQPYRFEVWMRGRARQPVSFQLGGFYQTVKPMRFQITPEWKKYSATFSVPNLNPTDKPGNMTLRLTGPGQFDVDNFRIFKDDAPYLALRPEDKTILANSGMGALRTHAFVKTQTRGYDLEQLTNPGGVSNIKGGNTLPQTLQVMRSVNMNPWLQIEPHFSRDEWLGLVEYLAAPFDPAKDDAAERPWAAKRYKQGHPAPWADDFDQIFFEIGNETWNGIMRPWIFQGMKDASNGKTYTKGQVYGLYQEYVLSILRESPYWPALAPKLVPVIGGWARQPDYGKDAAALSPNTPILAHAAYNGGWDEGEGPVKPTRQGFSTVLTQVLSTTLPKAREQTAAATALSRNRPTPLLTGTYEAGPGYALNGLNGARVSKQQALQQDQVMKSVAAGTATLDSFLLRALYGFKVQNYFTFGGKLWASHAEWNKGGQTYPSWDLLALFNREGRGDMLEVETHSVPTINLAPLKRREQVRNGPLVSVYATRQDQRMTVIVISRRVPGFPDAKDDGRTAVTVDLPIKSADSLTLHQLSGDYKTHNLDGPAAHLTQQALPPSAALPRLVIPVLEPGAALIYVFDGVQ